jgi:voltage-gated potassium channel
MHADDRRRAAWRERLYTIIFEHDTPAGRLFDVVLIAAIVASVLVVTLDSVAPLRARHGATFFALEWLFTLLFTVEYVLRLVSARGVRRYATSFLGVVDLLAILPTYLGLIFPAGRYFTVIRVLRVLRVFRVLKLAEYVGEATVLATALRRSSRKIILFVFTVLTIVVVVGALLYLVEGPAAGFTSIPVSMYWAIVTLTTVGYGDIAPQSPLGQALASLVMIMGYGIIAVPTGIVTVELAEVGRQQAAARCPACRADGHRPNARFCYRCAAPLPPDGAPPPAA